MSKGLTLSWTNFLVPATLSAEIEVISADAGKKFDPLLYDREDGRASEVLECAYLDHGRASWQKT